MLDAHAPEMPARVDEGGLEVGRLTTPDGTAELRQDILVCFTGQKVGDLATEQLGIQFPGGSLRRGVYVHEPAIRAGSRARQAGRPTRGRRPPRDRAWRTHGEPTFTMGQ